MISQSDRICLAILGVAAAVVLATLWAVGGLSGAVAPDTASYFAPLQTGNWWGEARHPLYGLLASFLGGSASAPGHVPLAQGLLHAAAAIALFAGARAGRIGSIGALCLSLAALFSQSGLYHLRLVLPESPATDALTFAFAGVLAAANSQFAYRLLLLPVASATTIAYLLRPSFLPAILVVPALWYALARRNGQTRRGIRTALLFALIVAPFLIQSGYRLRIVGDFNIVSFGGFNMSAMAGFMLSPEIVASLPERERLTAQAILSAREAAEAAGRVARTPLNSSGERSFTSAALGYFDIYARAYDDLLWGEIAKLRRADETWVAFNQRLTRFSFATVAAAPLRWAAWIVGGSARLVGRAIVANAPMLAALTILLVASLPAFARHSRLGGSASDLPVVCVVAIGWFAATAPLTVLAIFPATRYIDTAAVLLPAIPALLAAAIMQGRSSANAPSGENESG